MKDVFTEKEFDKLERILGFEIIGVFNKIWNERINVKHYWVTCKKSLKNSNNAQKQYWVYKIYEVEGVLRNQSYWLEYIALQFKEKLGIRIWKKLDKALRDNKPIDFMFRKLN